MAHFARKPIVTNELLFSVDASNQASFDSGSSPNDAINMVNNTITGSLKNGTTFIDNVWEFDGTDDYIDFGQFTGNDFNGTVPQSIEAWINSSNVPGTSGVIVSKMQPSGNFRGWTLTLFPSGFLGYYILPGASSYIGANSSGHSSLLDGNWHHVAITYDGNGPTDNDSTGMNFYIDGLPVGKSDASAGGGAATILGNTEPFLIGARGASSALFFDGQISNEKIYNKELTASEILQNFNAVRHRYGI
jgi:hypothetical protein